MAQVRDKKTGKIFQLRGAGLARAIDQGLVEVLGADTLELQEEGGPAITVDPSEVSEAISESSATAIAPEQRSSLAQEAILEERFGGLSAQGLGEAALSGATLGLSDILLGGDEEFRERRIRGTGTTVAELGGAIVPALLTGGTASGVRGAARVISGATPAGLAVKGAQRLSRALGGRSGRLAGGALEGSLFGVGQGISNLALSNEPLAAEAVLAELGMSAVYGAAFGLGGQALGESLGALGGKLIKKAETQALTKASIEELESVTRNLDELVRKGAPERVLAARSSLLDTLNIGRKLEITPKALDKLAKLTPQKIVDAGVKMQAYRSELVEAGFDSSVKQLDQVFASSVAGKETAETVTALVAFGIAETALPNFDGPTDDFVKAILAHKIAKGLGKKSFTREIAKQAARRSGERLALRAAGGNILAQQAAFVAGGKAVSATMDGLNSVNNAVGRTLAKTQKALGRLLKRSEKPLGKLSIVGPKLFNSFSFTGEEKRGKTTRESYQLRVDELRELMADPESAHRAINRAMAPIRQISTTLGDKMEMQAINTLQFLHSKVPQDPGRLLQMGQSKWQPTDSQIASFGRTLAAVQNPAKILEDLANRKLSPEAAEVLKVMHPAHFAELQAWMVQNLEEIQKKFTFKDRVQLSILLDIPADPSMRLVDTLQQDFLVDARAQGAEAERQSTDTIQGTEPTKAQEITER